MHYQGWAMAQWMSRLVFAVLGVMPSVAKINKNNKSHDENK